VPAQHRPGRPAGVGRTAGEQLIQRDAERVDVHCGRRPAAIDDLRGQVVRGADHRARRGDSRGTEKPRDAEVGQPRAALVEQDVVRLQVAVNDAVAVRLGERVGHLREQRGRRGRRQGALPPQMVAQAAPADQFHDQAERIPDGQQIVDPNDIRMVQHLQDRTFLQKSGDRFGLAHQLLMQQFHGDLDAAFHVDRAPHRTGRAGADRFGQPVRIANA
jgi:hypothetical protein